VLDAHFQLVHEGLTFHTLPLLKSFLVLEVLSYLGVSFLNLCFNLYEFIAVFLHLLIKSFESFIFKLLVFEYRSHLVNVHWVIIDYGERRQSLV